MAKQAFEHPQCLATTQKLYVSVRGLPSLEVSIAYKSRTSASSIPSAPNIARETFLPSVSSYSAPGSESATIPAADGDVDLSVPGDHRADRDVELHRAIGGEIADRSAVGAPPDRLEFVDDLHGRGSWARR